MPRPQSLTILFPFLFHLYEASSSPTASLRELQLREEPPRFSGVVVTVRAPSYGKIVTRPSKKKQNKQTMKV